MFDHCFRDFREERLAQSDLCTKSSRAANDHARDIVAPSISRDNAIRNQECRRTCMVRNDAIGRKVFIDMLPGFACERREHINRSSEEICLVVRVHALQHRDDALEAHTRVHMLGRQQLEASVIEEVVLNEDVIPQLEETRTLPVHAAAVLGASIGNCLSASLVFCLRKSRLEPLGVTTHVLTRLMRNEKGRFRVSDIEVDIKPEFSTADPDRLRRCEELFEDFCVVTESVRRGIPVTVKVENPASIKDAV